MVKHFNITVQGLVQGVLFRYSTKKEAEKLNIKGFAKNIPEGSVYIEAEGEEKNLNEFINWCKKGPELAEVNNIKVVLGEMKNFDNFETL